MIDSYTLEQCKKDNKVLELKIQNLEFAMQQSEKMIAESVMDSDSLTFLRRKVADSKQDLELLYLIKRDKRAVDRS